MSRRKFTKSERAPSPLDPAALQQYALSYLGRYATTRSKLRMYLARKVRERGWSGDDEPPLDAVVARCAELGYVDDAGFAAARGAALTRRGFGAQRVGAALRAVGIDRETTASVRAVAQDQALEAALAFARRKHIGPYAAEPADIDTKRRQLGQLLRAGHPPELARRIVAAAPGTLIDET